MKIQMGILALIVAVAFSPVIARAQAQGAAQADMAARTAQEPDGCQFKAQQDGSFSYISWGSGTYDFNDEDDIADARQEAEMKAKAAIAKYMNQQVTTDEESKQASRKSKKQTSENGEKTSAVSKETEKLITNYIRVHSSELLKGVVVLHEQKIPNNNGGGKMRVCVGISAKTQKAAAALKKSCNTDSGNGLKGAPAQAPAAPNNGYFHSSSGDF